MIKLLKKLFKRKITDQMFFKTLGKDAHIRNGVGYGFISDEYLYDNRLLEIGLGRVSNRWCDYYGETSSVVIKIVIDKDYTVKKIDGRKEDLLGLNVGDKLIVQDERLKKAIDTIFDFIPSKNHIGLDVFRSTHMLSIYTDIRVKNELDIRDSKYKQESEG